MNLQSVYQDPTFAEYGNPYDAKLTLDDETQFDVYSKPLSTHSEFFEAYFSIDEEIGQCTVIPGIEPDIFEIVLVYLYTSRINLTTENMMKVLVAADFLLIDSLQSECRIFMLRNKTIKNCVSVFLTAHRIKDFEIEYLYRRFILLCFQKAIENSACDFPYDVLKYFLGHKSINASGERVIWSLIVTWVLKDPSHRMACVPELLRFLSINEIDDKLASDIISSPIIRENELYRDLDDPRHTLPYLSDKHKAQVILVYRNDVPLIAGYRLPSSVYFVTRWSLKLGGVEMFMSYDETMDMWRKVGSLSAGHLNLLRIGHRIYIFDMGRFRIRDIKVYSYDLLKSEIKSLCPIPDSDFVYSQVVEVAGRIIASRGHFRFVRYVDETDEWTDIHTIPYIFCLRAVSLNGYLYIIGNENEGGMVMRVYDPSSDSCALVAPPMIGRIISPGVVYQGKIFLIGGALSFTWTRTKAVEVYDPHQNDWTMYPELLFEYLDPSPFVWQGRLYVHDKQMTTTPITFWDGSAVEWRVVDEPSSLRELEEYRFCVVEGEGEIREIMEKNKTVDVSEWEESRLDKELL